MINLFFCMIIIFKILHLFLVSEYFIKSKKKAIENKDNNHLIVNKNYKKSSKPNILLSNSLWSLFKLSFVITLLNLGIFRCL